MLPVWRRCGGESILDAADERGEGAEVLAMTRPDVVDAAPPSSIRTMLAPNADEKHVFDSIFMHGSSVRLGRLASVYF